MKTRLISLTACVALLATPPVVSAKSSAQAEPDRTEQKIRLLEQALAARDRGDFPAAISGLEDLLREFPADPQLRSLLSQVQERASHPEQAPVASRPVVLPDPRVEDSPSPGSAKQPASVPQAQVPAQVAQPPPAPSEALLIRSRVPKAASTDVAALVREETDRQTYYIEKARRDLWYVRSLGDEGRHAEALRNLASVGTDLPTNPRTLPLLQEIAATKVDLEHRLRVAALNPGAEPPRLSLTKDDIAAVARSDNPLSKRTLTLELHLLELSGDLIDDFWTAWRFFSETTETRGPVRIHQSIQGRTNSLYRPGGTPTKRQQELLWAFRLAAPRVFNSTPLPSKDRSLGFVAFLDAGAVVRILSTMEGCRVLGSPSWQSFAGQGASLSLAPERDLATSASDEEAKVGWQIRVSPQLSDAGRSAILDLQPKLTRYAGFVPAADDSPGATTGGAMLAPVYSTHELHTRIQVPVGATIVMTGLEWQQVPAKAPPPGSPVHMPLIGNMIRARTLMAERSELLILLTTKLDQP